MNHRCVERILTGKLLHDRCRPMPNAIDVAQSPASSHLFLQLLKLTVEQQNVTHHQIAGIAANERFETFCLLKIVGYWLFKQHCFSRFQQSSSDAYMRRSRTGHNPGFRIRFFQSLIETCPAGNVRDFVSDRIQRLGSPRHKPRQTSFCQSTQSQRVQSSKSPEPNDANADRFKSSDLVFRHAIFRQTICRHQ